MKPNKILLIILISVFLFNVFLIVKNPDCPHHVDYIQYEKSINNFYEKRIIDDNVNGKYIYTYLMAILLTPFKYLGFSIYNSMVFITGIFQLLIIYLFYKYTKSIMKTLLMITTLTFLTFIGQPDTIMMATIPLLLFFIYRDKPYSEFLIMSASFIRLDFAIYYLFSKRKKTTLIPISITFLQWLNGRFFIDSDIGLNTIPLTTIAIFIMSFGLYILLFTYLAKPIKNNYDHIIHAAIIIFLIFFLKYPSQKVFFVPVILAFMIYDFNFRKLKRNVMIGLVTTLITINIVMGFYADMNRANLCTPRAYYEYSLNYEESIYFGTLQPYLDYYNRPMDEPYQYQVTMDCKDAEHYFYAEDWRNPMLLFKPGKLCLEP